MRRTARVPVSTIKYLLFLNLGQTKPSQIPAPITLGVVPYAVQRVRDDIATERI
jgi:hypothetical protein